jgi:hypothetical protein
MHAQLDLVRLDALEQITPPDNMPRHRGGTSRNPRGLHIPFGPGTSALVGSDDTDKAIVPARLSSSLRAPLGRGNPVRQAWIATALRASR